MFNSRELQQEIGNRQGIATAIDLFPLLCMVSGSANIVAKFAKAWKDRGI